MYRDGPITLAYSLPLRKPRVSEITAIRDEKKIL